MHEVERSIIRDKPYQTQNGEVEGEEKGQTSVKDPEVSSQASSESAVKNVLEEANKMLRSISTSSSGLLEALRKRMSAGT